MNNNCIPRVPPHLSLLLLFIPCELYWRRLFASPSVPKFAGATLISHVYYVWLLCKAKVVTGEEQPLAQ